MVAFGALCCSSYSFDYLKDCLAPCSMNAFSHAILYDANFTTACIGMSALGWVDFVDVVWFYQRLYNERLQAHHTNHKLASCLLAISSLGSPLALTLALMSHDPCLTPLEESHIVSSGLFNQNHPVSGTNTVQCTTYPGLLICLGSFTFPKAANSPVKGWH